MLLFGALRESSIFVGADASSSQSGSRCAIVSMGTSRKSRDWLSIPIRSVPVVRVAARLFLFRSSLLAPAFFPFAPARSR